MAEIASRRDRSGGRVIPCWVRCFDLRLSPRGGGVGSPGSVDVVRVSGVLGASEEGRCVWGGTRRGGRFERFAPDGVGSVGRLRGRRGLSRVRVGSDGSIQVPVGSVGRSVSVGRSASPVWGVRASVGRSASDVSGSASDRACSGMSVVREESRTAVSGGVGWRARPRRETRGGLAREMTGGPLERGARPLPFSEAGRAEGSGRKPLTACLQSIDHSLCVVSSAYISIFPSLI